MNHLLVYLTFFYISGIILCSKFQLLFNIQYLVLSIVLLLIFYPLVKKFFKSSSFIKFFIIFFIFVFAGGLSYKLHTEIFPKNHVKYFIGEKPEQVFITGKIVDDPEINEDTGKSYFNIRTNKINEKDVNGLVRVTVFGIFSEESFNYGDSVGIKGSLYKPRSASNPGEFDYEKYLANKKIFALLFVNPKKDDYIEKIESKIWYKKNPFLSLAYKIKHYIIRIIYRTMPDFRDVKTIWSDSLVQGNLLEGILLGNRVLPKEYEYMFRDTGTMHILAVSGFNVSFVIFMFFMILRSLRISKKISAIISIIFVILFAAITGFTPSVSRAALMAIVVLFAIVLERDTDILNSIAFSSLVILIISPLSLFDIGFQLSYAATLGIVYLTPFIIEKLYFLPKWLSGTIGVSISAQLAVLPLLIVYFNRISIISIITNIIIVPIAGLITVLGFLTFFISFILPLAKLVCLLNWFFLTILLEIITFASSVSYASILVPSVSLVSIFIYYIAVVIIKNYSKIIPMINQLFSKTLGLLKVRQPSKIWINPLIWTIPGCGLVLGMFVIYLSAEFRDDNTLKITFLNLKRSYSQYVEFPDKSNMLIGAGTNFMFDQGERIVSQFLLKVKKKITLDNVVVAGTRVSDCGGLNYILSNFRVKNLFVLGNFTKKYNPKTHSKAFLELMELVREKKIPLKIFYDGDAINLCNGITAVVHSNRNKGANLFITYGKINFSLPSDNKKHLKYKDNALVVLTDGYNIAYKVSIQ